MPGKSKKAPSKPAVKDTKTGMNPLIKISAMVIFAAVIIFLVVSNLIKKNEPDKEYMFRKDGTLTFQNTTGQVESKIDIQIADNDFDRELGLMYRKHMAENEGMLFIFPQDTIQTFWMRNTFIPLDMVFINSNDKIVSISRNTQILSDQTYSSAGPAMYVLEVNAGFCDKFGIKAGDKIVWKRVSKQSL